MAIAEDPNSSQVTDVPVAANDGDSDGGQARVNEQIVAVRGAEDAQVAGPEPLREADAQRPVRDRL